MKSHSKDNKMITLTFTIDEDYDKEDLIRALNAGNAYACISEIHRIFRSPAKYGVFEDISLTEDQIELLEKVHEKIISITQDLPEQF